MRQGLRRPANWWRRAISLATLLAFFVANLGLPLLPARAEESDAAGATTAPAIPSGGNCCCGTRAKSSACGCSRVAANGKAAGCCAARSVAKTPERAPVKTRSKSIPSIPVVSCPCEGAPAADFIVVAQPKLAIAAVSVMRPEPTTDFLGVESPHSAGLRSAPELPPPRASAC